MVDPGAFITPPAITAPVLLARRTLSGSSVVGREFAVKIRLSFFTRTRSPRPRKSTIRIYCAAKSVQRVRLLELSCFDVPRPDALDAALLGCGFGVGCDRVGGGELLTGRELAPDAFCCGCELGRLTTLWLERFCERDEDELCCDDGGGEKSSLALV